MSSGNGRDRVTVRCAKYDLRSDAREELKAFGISTSSLDLIWVDTVGWDDADLQGKKDSDGSNTILSNELEHHFSNIERTRTCSLIGNRTRTPYFWL